MSNFRIGMEVVCIDDGNWLTFPTFVQTAGPQKGDVHRIAGIVDTIIGVCLQFSEWPNDCFHHDNFRPVVKTDISIFTAMLDKAPKREVENV